MKRNWDFIITAIVVVIFMIIGLCSSCKHEVPAPEIRYITLTDTIIDSSYVNRVVYLEYVLKQTRDSLDTYKNDTTISEDLFEAKYKLERIKYYNDIAAKGNNIKFLRGWINRVLND